MLLKDTALVYAVRQQNIVLVRLLLNKNAYMDLQDNSGVTVFEHAVNQGNLEMTNLLLQHGVGMDGIHNVEMLMGIGRTGNTEILERLLVSGMSANIKSGNNKTVLMYTAYNGYKDMVNTC